MKPLAFQITLTQHEGPSKYELEVGQEELISMGASFWEIQTDLMPIYENFNILSYFSSTSKIKLHDAKEFVGREKSGNVYKFSFNKREQPYYLFQLQKDDYRDIFSKPGEALKIKYSITKNLKWPESQEDEDEDEVKVDEIPSSNIINVQFTVVEKKNTLGEKIYEIVISVQDQDGWILNNIYPVHYYRCYKYDRISQRRRSKRRRNNNPNNEHDQQLIRQQNIIELPARLELPEFTTDLQYFYMEPEKKRNKVIKKKHIALALQGGGCKGVTYIGAYKAIFDYYQKEGLDITTIIGSSAGGIFALAICCRMASEDIVGLCEKYLSKVTDDKTFHQKNQQTDIIIKRYLETLEKALRQFNILDGKIIEIIKKLLEDEQIQDFIFDTLKFASGLDKNEKVLSLFEYEDGQKNICGLLSGKLMTGEKVGLIAESCLVEMVESKRFEKKVNKYFKGLEKKDLKQWAKKLTMKQLYDITGIEFTCTSVDVSNHILRYFNHKTTPGLPVVNAVQMTGAFPVAFQATYWKKEWGKYYIHYDTMRREVDLEGSKFTDGGMLANFPIDCIDNEEMRPMYFSHVKDSTNTIMYGVGLQQSDSPNKQQQKNKSQKSLGLWKIAKKLGVGKVGSLFPQLISSKSTIINSILTKFSSSRKQQIDITTNNLLMTLREIPLIDFLFNLGITFTSTKDKLAEECFRHQAYQIRPTKSTRDYMHDRQTANEEVNQDIDQLTKVLKQTLDHKYINPLKALKQNLIYFKKQKQPSTEQQLYEIQNKVDIILSNLMINYLFVEDPDDKLKKEIFDRVCSIFKEKQVEQGISQFDLIMKSVQKKRDLKIFTQQQLNIIKQKGVTYCVNRIIYKLETMKSAKIFLLSEIKKDYNILLRMVSQTILIIEQFFKQEKPLVNKYLPDVRKQQENKLKQIIQKIQNRNLNEYQQTKNVIKKLTKIMDQKIRYNQLSTFSRLVTRNPYQNDMVINLLSKLNKFIQLRQKVKDIQFLLKDIDNNQKIQSIKNHLTRTQQIIYRVQINNIFTSDLVSNLLDLQNSFITLNISDIKKINQKILNLKSCVQLVIGYERYNNRGQVRSYIKRSINQTVDRFGKQPNGLHLVMQSISFSELYFFHILQTLKSFQIQMKSYQKQYQDRQIIDNGQLNRNQTDPKRYNIPISSITISNLQSIAAILYISDLGTKKVYNYLNQIKQLTYENEERDITKIQKRLNSGQWAKKTPILLKNLTNVLIDQARQNNLFVQTQKYLNSGIKNQQQFTTKIKNMQTIAQDYKQRVNQLISQQLNCIMNEIYKQTQTQSKTQSQELDKKLDKIAKSLALTYKKKDYSQKDSDVDPALQLGQMLIQKFIDLFKSVLEQSTYIFEELVYNVCRDQRKQAWKGLVLGQINSSLKIKKLVQRIMLDLGLTKDTTLQEFYRVNQKKITLNFTVINTNDYCIKIYNHQTRPYMPVWAAVVASSSLIQFFKPLNDRSQWSYKLVKDIQQRNIKKYFSNKQIKNSQLYSADTLRKLPIDLLKNNVISKKMHESSTGYNIKSEAFLIFHFQNDYFSKKFRHQDHNKITTTNMNGKDLLFIYDNFEKIKNSITNMPLLTGNYHRLKLYVNSHDNLITSLYKNQLINLPIRLGTLDFHLMCQKINGEDKLTNICNDTIMQSYYVMKQKILNQESIKKVRNRKIWTTTEIQGQKQRWIIAQKSIRNQQTKILQKRWKKQEQPKIKDPKLVKRLYFRVESKNSSVFSKQEHKLVIRFLSMFVPNKSFKQDYKLYYKPNNNAAQYKLLTDEYLRLNTVDSLSLKIEYVDIIKDESLKVRYKIKTKCFKFDLRNFSELANAGRRFGYVYSLEYTENAEKQLEPDGGFRGDYRLDYIIGENERNISIEQLRIPIFLQNAENVLKYEKPVCKHLHTLKLQDKRKNSIQMQENTGIFKKTDNRVYQCQTCKSNNEQKYKYSIKQKYQIKQEKDNSIKCVQGHDLILSRRLAGFPIQINFILCDRCGKNNPLGFFKDVKCKVDICFTCVFNMINDEL